MTGSSMDVDSSKPHSARIYDYFIGGKNHFAADRAAAEEVLRNSPSVRVAARGNRAFLGRAVHYLAAEAGLRQFLDIGTGLPTMDNVHDIAQAVRPDARVVYVDNDPLVLTHARALLTSSPEGRTAYINADLRDPESILDHPSTREVLDFSQPIGLIMVAILHFMQDGDKPTQIVRTLLDALPPGSYLVASHLTTEHDPVATTAGMRVMNRAGVTMQKRDSDVFARLAFSDLEVVPPGVTLVSEWRPDDTGPRPSAAEVSCYGGVARKP